MKADAVYRIKKSAIHEPRVLNEPHDYAKRVSFSRGMRVELADCTMLFISGTASVDEQGQTVHVGDFEKQAGRTFHNIASLLNAEGADWHDVVRATCYLVDFAHYDVFNRVRNNFFDDEGLDPYPASTCIQATLCRPELLVEVEAIAMIPKGRS